MDDKNLALKGPPGTGKSQTITNIIAAALAKGRSVLFVAEKMAALDVVKKRLTDADLGDFCFEIHSTKARKKELLAALEARLEIQNKLQPPKKLEAAVAELEKRRNQLSDYVGLINTEFGAGGKTVHSILWAEQRSRHAGGDLPKALDNVRLANVEALTEAEFTERLRTCLQVEGEGHGYPRQTDLARIAVAKWLCRTSDRYIAPRVSGPNADLR